MKKISVGLLVGLCLISAACSTSSRITGRRYRSARLEKYPPPPMVRTLQPGDPLKISLYTDGSEVLDRVMDEKGQVSLPHLPPLKIGGLSTGAAEELIRKAYVNGGFYKEGAIQVAVVPPASEFFVEGQVNRPGSYKFTRNVTVLEAVAMAGGPTAYAHRRLRKLIRRGQVFIIDARKVADGVEPDRFVEPGDIVNVPQGAL